MCIYIYIYIYISVCVCISIGGTASCKPTSLPRVRTSRIHVPRAGASPTETFTVLWNAPPYFPGHGAGRHGSVEDLRRSAEARSGPEQQGSNKMMMVAMMVVMVMMVRRMTMFSNLTAVAISIVAIIIVIIVILVEAMVRSCWQLVTALEGPKRSRLSTINASSEHVYRGLV